MDWGDVIGGAVGFLAGGGGLVAFYRARSQNRVDERTQLSKNKPIFGRRWPPNCRPCVPRLPHSWP